MEPDVVNDVLIAQPTSVDGQVRSDALVARSNRLSGRKRITVGCDCCGLGSVWIALLALFAGTTGPWLELAFVSDTNPAVRRYVREQYRPWQVYTDVRERDNSDIKTPASTFTRRDFHVSRSVRRVSRRGLRIRGLMFSSRVLTTYGKRGLISSFWKMSRDS